MLYTTCRLKNKLLKHRLAKEDIKPLARANLCALDNLNMKAPALDQRYVVVDLETTGLDTKKDRVVSVGAFRIVGGRIRLGEIFSELVNPGRNIPPASIRIHAIMPDTIRNARPAWEVFHDFLEYLGHDILVAHHARFDMVFINRVMREQFGFKLQNLVVDTIMMCRHAFPDPDTLGLTREVARCNLDALAERFGIEVPERHTALGDAFATALIFQRLLDVLKNSGHSTLGQLYKLAGVWR